MRSTRGHYTRVARLALFPLQQPYNSDDNAHHALAAMTADQAGVASNGTNGNPRNDEEYQYLDLVRDILDNGEHRPDR